jgi:hypothetical protein
LEKSDYTTAVSYLNNILNGCAEASEKHAELKIQCLIKDSKLKEAVDYAKRASE